MRINQPLKWHGGKYYLAQKIIKAMPPHLHYVEPYAGGLAILLAKNPTGTSEAINDLNGQLMNFWTVLRDPQQFQEFKQRCEATPFSEQLWRSINPYDPLLFPTTNHIEHAWRLFVRCRLSLAGRMKSFTPITKTRLRRGMNNDISAWLTAIEGLPLVHQRLQRVLLLHRPALEVITSQDGPDTLQYLDPTYLDETRTAPDVYDLEMTPKDHECLLDLIIQCKSKIIISGYPSSMYNSKLSSWNQKTFIIPNQAAGGKTKRRMQEVIYLNF